MKIKNFTQFINEAKSSNIIEIEGISLKNLKIANNLSRDTTAYTAIICLNGVPICDAENDGHGGSDNFRPLKGKTYKEVEDLEKLAEKINGRKYEALSCIVAELMDKLEYEKVVQRNQKNCIVYTKDGELYKISYKLSIEELLKSPNHKKALEDKVKQLKSEDKTVLNTNLNF